MDDQDTLIAGRITIKTIKRWILIILTVLAIYLFGFSLWSSWQEPRIQSSIELYQTNLLLQALEGQNPDQTENSSRQMPSPLVALLGQEKPYQAALKDYLKSRTSLQNAIDQKIQTYQFALKRDELSDALNAPNRVQRTPLPEYLQLFSKLNQLDLRLGILQAHEQQIPAALKTWNAIVRRTDTLPAPQSGDRIDNMAKPLDPVTEATAQVLIGLWSDLPQLLPEAETQLQDHLNGWFRYQALNKLYQLQQRSDALATLQTTAEAAAENALVKLAIANTGPGIGLLGGIGLLIFVTGQRLLKGREAWIAKNADERWSPPWDGEIVWQVMILTFFLVGQVLIPLGFEILGIKTSSQDQRATALVILANYTLFSLGGVLILWGSLKPFLPLPKDWFNLHWRDRWFSWGLGGYLVALPLVVFISVINERIWQGQGGSNPLLPIALNNRDPIALVCFLFTAAIAAPVFEELMFRGFLLPSLTRYFSVRGSIGLSSLLFAIAHLSLSEILPLTTLGIVLGVVYTRSRNLLAPMLLHSLWNSGTLLTLFILGSGAQAG
jgi:uncharacterized protein